MSRRIRFSKRLCTGLFAGAAALAAGPARAGEVPFAAQPPISVTATNAYSVALADLDRDGDLDVLSATEGAGGRVAWHENLGGSWAQHTIAAGSSLCVRTDDLDGDGDLDVVATAGAETGIAWYENAAGNGSTWVARTVGTVAGGARSVHAADVDGDGDRDVLAASQGDDRVAWFENTAGNGTAWTVRTIATATGGADPFSVFSGDVDGDGDTDVLSASIGSGVVAWHENTTGAGTAWATRTITTLAAGAASVHAADLDRDGDLDVLSASLADNTVAWYENTTGAGTAWTRHTISVTADGALSVSAADVDADGDQDAVAVALFGGSVAWYENTAGDGSLWTTRPVATNVSSPFEAAVGDVDGDGDPDLVAAVYGSGSITWYRDEALHQTACFATPPPVGTAAGARSVFGADVDGDGDPDALAAAPLDSGLSWFDNAAGDGSLWLERTITTAAPVAFSVAAADLDGDGDEDALTVLLLGDAVLWYENTAGNGSAWTVHTIATGADGPRMATAADVDRDGDADVVAVVDGAGALAWYDNAAGDGSTWTAHTITTALSSPYTLITADVDGDGDPDVFGQSNPTGTLAWYENLASGTSWAAHTVTTTSLGVQAVSAADLDRDGDTDLMGGSSLGVVRWYENTAGDGTTWTPRTMDTAADDVRALATVDLDRDGDPDALSVSLFQNNVAWYENAAGDASVWTPHLITNGAVGSRAVATADFDGDGLPDALAASDTIDRVGWYHNRGGQFALTADNTAPPGAINGSQVPMLRVVAAHGGRAGDGDLELARLGLGIEEAPGDPYTTAEANAVIEAIRVYRDANGNGVFDLGTDVQVAIVTDLALTAGRQEVPFADGDPEVQVAAGAPRTYFVIAELTADASTHAPNNFRVVHLGLGPSASAAEDRTHDLALRPACPADVPSSVVVPITPVELTGFQVE
jgi:VCBS repeat protein